MGNKIITIKSPADKDIQVFTWAESSTLNTCHILGEKLLCLPVGKLWLSDFAILICDEMGINLTDPECVKEILAKKNLIQERYPILKQEAINKGQEFIEKCNKVIVTTGDLKEQYTIIGPVYYQVSNKGIFSSELSKMTAIHTEYLTKIKAEGQGSQGSKNDWGFLYGEFSVGQKDFDRAFFVSVQEIKKRAARLGADAVICMRQDIDLDATNLAYFYMQMYGTAVKFA